MSPEMIGILINGFLQTLAMVCIACGCSVLFGLPLGILLFLTRRHHILSAPWAHKILSAFVNIIRSIPFIILMVAITPLTQLLVGSSIGTAAATIPLLISATPFVARLIESAFAGVNPDLLESAQAMGATPWQIISKILLPEALPDIVRAITLTLITLVGYSAMAGAVGGGGLGDIAIQYGYQRFSPSIMLVTVVMLVVLVQSLQWGGDRLARRLSC